MQWRWGVAVGSSRFKKRKWVKKLKSILVTFTFILRFWGKVLYQKVLSNLNGFQI